MTDYEHRLTKGERRAAKRRRRSEMAVSGRSVVLLMNLAAAAVARDKAKRAARKGAR